MIESRFQPLWFVGLLVATWAYDGSIALGQAAPDRPVFTLTAAVETAFRSSPLLKAQQAAVAEAEGRLISAKMLEFNPTFDLEAGKRRSPAGDESADLSVGLSQEVAIAGQRGHRIDAARSDLKAVQAQADHNSRILVAQVNIAFFEALRARDLLDVARQDAELAHTLLDTAQRRQQAGDTTQLEVNLSTAEMGRAEERLFMARADSQEAQALLAELLGLEPTTPYDLQGDLAEAAGPVPALQELLLAAASSRADLEGYRLLEASAQARNRLARSEAIPNLAFSGFYSREGGSDVIVGGGVAFTLPTFNRNQGAIAETRATLQRVSVEREIAQLQVKREVAVTYARYSAAAESVTRLQQTVLGTLEENLTLLQKAFEAGKTSWTEVVVIRRTFIDARREYVEAAMMARRDRVLLDLAAGRLTIPETEIQDEKR